MSISVSCTCGKKLSVKDELAGKRGKCPACGTMLTIPQPPKPAEPEWGLVPLDEEPEQRTKSLQQVSKPVAKPSLPAAKKSLGGPDPPPLDLPPLGDELAAPNHASWIDEGAETDFKVAGAPLPSGTGQIFAAPPAAVAMAAPPGGHPGQLLCPYCNKDLERTVTTGSILTQIALGLFAGFYFTPTTPFRCRSCGPIKFEELHGESKRTAEQSSAKRTRGCLYGGLAVVGGFVLLLLLLMLAAGDFGGSRAPPPPEDPSEVERRQKEYDQRVEQQRILRERRLRENEERRRQSEERFKKMTQQNQRPATPLPDPAPRPENPVTPLPTPRPTPTPMQPASPFEEIPPLPKMPMPVNPFQPVD